MIEKNCLIVTEKNEIVKLLTLTGTKSKIIKNTTMYSKIQQSTSLVFIPYHKY